MSGLPGTNISAVIVPFDSNDTFATHDQFYGKGGFKQVSTLLERDAITSERRTEGMYVNVSSTGNVYILQGGITNSNWVLSNLSTLSVSGGQFYINGIPSDNSNNFNILGSGSISVSSDPISHSAIISFVDPITRSEVVLVSSNLQAQITSLNIIGGSGLQVIESPTNTFTVNVTGTFSDITRSEVVGATGNLQSQINNLTSIVAGISSNNTVENLTTIENNTTLVLRPNGTGGVNWGSIPSINHNDLLNIQGGNIGEYYHLTQTQFNDYIGKSEVALISAGINSKVLSISANYTPITLLQSVSGSLQNQITNEISNRSNADSFLQSQINNITGNYVTRSLLTSVSGSLQSQINNETSLRISSDSFLQSQINIISGSYIGIGSLSPYTLLTTTAGISSNLQGQISSINLVAGTNVTVTPGPSLTWTISSVGGGGGSLWTPVQGTGISITAPTTASYQFSVIDYISKTQVTAVSATLGALITSETNSRISSDNYLQSQLVSLSGNYTPITLTQSISGNLQTQITNEVNLRNIQVISLSANYTPYSLTRSISGNLQSQINNLPVANIFRTEVMTVSGFLQSEIVSISATYTPYGLTRSISGNLQSQINNITGNYTLISTTRALTGNLQSQINLKANAVSGSNGVWNNVVVNSQGIVISGSNVNYGGQVDLSPYTLLSTTQNISSNLQSQINNITGNYTLISTTRALTGNLQTQINTKANITHDILTHTTGNTNSTLVLSPDGIGGVTWATVSVSAAAVNHNTLSGLQGGQSSQYFHLTNAQYLDYIGKTEVTGISSTLNALITSESIFRINADSFLQNQINIISGSYIGIGSLSPYTLLTTTSAISGNLQNQINTRAIAISSGSGIWNNVVVNSQGVVTSGSYVNYGGQVDLSGYTPLALTQSVSGNLQSQINNITGNYTLISTTRALTGNLQTQINAKASLLYQIPANESQFYYTIYDSSLDKILISPVYWKTSYIPYREVIGSPMNILATYTNANMYDGLGGNIAYTECGGILLTSHRNVSQTTFDISPFYPSYSTGSISDPIMLWDDLNFGYTASYFGTLDTSSYPGGGDAYYYILNNIDGIGAYSSVSLNTPHGVPGGYVYFERYSDATYTTPVGSISFDDISTGSLNIPVGGTFYVKIYASPGVNPDVFITASTPNTFKENSIYLGSTTNNFIGLLSYENFVAPSPIAAVNIQTEQLEITKFPLKVKNLSYFDYNISSVGYNLQSNPGGPSLGGTSFGGIWYDNTTKKIMARKDGGTPFEISETASISANLQTQINVIKNTYTLLTTTSSISGYLNDKINSINVIGGNNIQVIESPSNIWTISVSGSLGDITKSEVANVTGQLQSQIDSQNDSINTLYSTYITSSTVATISAGLLSKIISESERNIKQINQNSHGFAVGDCIRYNGSAWVKANANSANNSEAIGIVETQSINTFTIVFSGFITLPNKTFILGAVYYLSDTVDGQLTDTEPTTNNSISKPMLVALSATSGIVYNMRGNIVYNVEFVDTSSDQIIYGTKTFMSPVTFNAGIFTPITSLPPSTTTYNISASDYTILVNNTSVTTVLLPLVPLHGRELIIKKLSNNNINIIIDGNGYNIDYSPTLTFNTYLMSRTIQFNDTPGYIGWYVL
jgi:hypothetical protein